MVRRNIYLCSKRVKLDNGFANESCPVVGAKLSHLVTCEYFLYTAHG